MAYEVIKIDTADPTNPTRDVVVDRVAGQDMPVTKLDVGADGALSGPVSAANPMPISAAALPLPAGAATQATLASILAALVSTPTVTLDAAALAALETITVALDAGSLAALESITATGPLTDTQLRATAVPVTANAGTNLNTSALALDATLAAQSAKLPATIGQKAMAASLAVVVASDQSAVPVTDTALGEVAGSPTANTVNARLKALGLQHPTALGVGGGMMVEGNVASDAPATANPLMAGGRASTATPTPVSADGDAVALWVTRSGAAVIDGGVAHDAVDSQSPAKIGGYASATAPVAVSAGDRVNAWFGLNGELVIGGLQAAAGDGATNTVTFFPSNQGNALALTVDTNVFNGGTWDRLRNNHEVTLLASAARTATNTGSDQTNYNARAAYIVIDVTAGAAAPGLTPAIQMKDSLSGKYIQLHANLTKIIATGTYVYHFGTSAPAAAGGVTASSGFVLPRVWRLVMTADDATSYTYSAAVNYIN